MDKRYIYLSRIGLKRLVTNLLCCISLLITAGTVQLASADNSEDDERLLKAAYLYNFAKFTEWPKETWINPGDSLNLCIAGKDELVGELVRLGGKTIKQRYLTVLSLSNLVKPESCHLLYIATSEKDRYRDILVSSQHKPVLTISEIAGFTANAGHIELYREKGKTRFIINLGAAREVGLNFSSRLLILAIVLDDEATP